VTCYLCILFFALSGPKNPVIGRDTSAIGEKAAWLHVSELHPGVPGDARSSAFPSACPHAPSGPPQAVK